MPFKAFFIFFIFLSSCCSAQIDQHKLDSLKQSIDAAAGKTRSEQESIIREQKNKISKEKATTSTIENSNGKSWQPEQNRDRLLITRIAVISGCVLLVAAAWKYQQRSGV